MSKKYKVSVQMAVYNVEPYIDEAIESIINQDIGFKENVQLILINDGSTDDSESHCLKYADKYPDNILYIKKENGGLSSVRNAGLKHTNAQYVTFTDPDDTLEPNTLSEVYNFMEEHRDEIDQAGIPLYFFEAKTGLHAKYNFIGNTNRVIDLNKEPYNFILSAASMFYKSEVIIDKVFDETMVGGEDTDINVQLYHNNPKIGYVCENGVKYNYRQREAQDSIVNSLKTNIKGFTSVSSAFKSFDLDNLKPYEKEIIIYELRSRLNNIKKQYFTNPNEYEETIALYQKYISSIDSNFIVFESRWAESNELKELFLSFKDEHLKDYIDNHEYQDLFKVNIKNYYVKDNKLIIEALFSSYGSHLDLILINSKKETIKATESKDLDTAYNAIYGDYILDQTHYRHFEIDLQETKLSFVLNNTKTKKQFKPEIFRVDTNTSLAIQSKIIMIRRNNYDIYYNKGVFSIEKSKIPMFIYILKTTLGIFIKRKYLPFMRLFAKKNKKYILVNDRPDKAGDNGEALFKYICNNEKELAKHTYFVINKTSSDYTRLKSIGKVVAKGSIKHRYLFMNAKKIYSSHNARVFYSPYEMECIRCYLDLFDYTFIWLQHGITKDDISAQSNRLNTKDDYIITTTNEEFKEFSQEKYFYKEGQILLTGFPRFDSLENDSKNIISVCPTWRKNLTGKITSDGKHETLADFDQTDYYNNYKELLSNKKLTKLLKDNNYELRFILHPGVSGYKEYFDAFANDYIKIIPQEEVSYNQVFKESKLLITDYSSVFFDFAYLSKPEIFFQFDSDTFFENHYKKGYFDYQRDAFGDILDTPKQVIDKIEYYFKNDFVMEDKYKKRVENTFKYIDTNNCKRVIEETTK